MSEKSGVKKVLETAVPKQATIRFCCLLSKVKEGFC
jgi:hypothetical protein